MIEILMQIWTGYTLYCVDPVGSGSYADFLIKFADLTLDYR